ncbi:hypothetical protein LguiA_011047 [Lonicera macranthoides]
MNSLIREICGCVAAKGEESGDCQKFAKYDRSLCPGEWEPNVVHHTRPKGTE